MKDLTTIIYYTDNAMDEELHKLCRERLNEAAAGKRIISVSQKPMDVPDNICVGDIGRSHLNLFKQMLEGVQRAETKYIALAEHDCLYTQEHFNFIPPSDIKFYYNINHFFVSTNDGIYSWYRRKVLSQMIANRLLAEQAIKERILVLSSGAQIAKGQPGACEFGVVDSRKSYKNYLASIKDLGKDIGHQRAAAFATVIPNLDIRHGKNWSGNRRARRKVYTLPYWGSFYKVLGKIPPGEWYQEATINGIEMPARREKDTSEGRWEKLIKPVLPIKDGRDRIFWELGCNAGFNLRKAVGLGFKCVGVEKEKEFLHHAHYWESCEPKGIKIINGDIRTTAISTSHIILMSLVHYWLTPEELRDLIVKLKNKTLYVVIVGRHLSRKEHLSPCDENELIKSFNGWECIEVRNSGKHYSAVFKNPDLYEMETEDVILWKELYKSKYFVPAYRQLIRNVIAGKKIIKEETDYYKYLKHRKNTRMFKNHVRLITSIKEFGIADPILMKGEVLMDGDHRLIIAKALGIKKVICKKV